MINLYDPRMSSTKEKTAANAAPVLTNVTALYERLSRDDDLEGESNSITNE